MSTDTSSTMIAVDDGEFSAHLALPSAAPAPGIVVLQEIFGVNDNIKAIADWLAQSGFCVCAPDLFWRLEPNFVCNMGGTPDEALYARAFELFPKFDFARAAPDIQASISWLRQHKACNGKVGVLGYCLGGNLAYLSAVRTDSDVSVGYYGVNISAHLGEADAIRKPLLLHIATADEFVSPEEQSAMHHVLDGHSQATLHDYADEPHGFARKGSEHYSATNAPLADARSLEFLRGALT